jgi:hypothetical protein
MDDVSGTDLTLDRKELQVERTQWHRILARLFELLFTHLGVTVLTELPVMGEPPRIDILLVRREGKHWTEKQMRPRNS